MNYPNANRYLSKTWEPPIALLVNDLNNLKHTKSEGSFLIISGRPS